MRRLVIGLFLVGVITAVVGRLEPYYIARPRILSLAEALAAVERPGQEMVVVEAAPERGVKWYGAKYLGTFGDKHFDASEKEIPLGKYSPTAGIPLVGPQAPPASERPSLVGYDVIVEGPLGGRRLMFSSQNDVEVGDTKIKGVISRRILSSLAGDENVWVLSTTQTTLGGLPGRQPDYNKAEQEWAASKKFSGVLKRLRDYEFSGTSFESIKAEYRSLYGDPAALDEAWLIDVGDRNDDGRGNEGWYYYVPVAGSEGKIWAQVSVDAATQKVWDEMKPAEVTGVWLPAGLHRFDRSQAGYPSGKVALVQTSNHDRQKFIERRWSEWWGRFTVFLGCAMVVLSGLLFLIYKIISHDPSPVTKPDDAAT